MRRWSGFALLLLALAALACGGDKGDGEDQPESPAPAPAPTDITEMSPEQLGERVGDVYVDALRRTAEMMEARPSVEELRPDLEQLKAEAIEKLVPIGELREAMSEADRAKMDAVIRQKTFGSPKEFYDSFREGHKHFAAEDRELGNLISSINIIGQYAAFELLRKQAPEEAKRLGIE
jgi:hypothetical protein